MTASRSAPTEPGDGESAASRASVLHHQYFRLPEAVGTHATEPVATVGGEAIRAESFHTELGYAAGKPNENGAFDNAVAYALKKVIQRQLLRNAFAPDEVAIEAARARMRQRQVDTARKRLGEDADLTMVLNPWESDSSFGRKEAVDHLLTAQAMNRLEMSLPDRDDAIAYYESHPEEFQTQTVVEARVVSARHVAEVQDPRVHIAEVHEDFIAEGADRDALFEQHRDPIYGLVSVTEDDAHSPEANPVARVAFEQQVDQISEPFEHRGIWMLVWTHTRHEAGLIPFEKVEENLLERLRFEAREHAWTTLSARLLKQSEVTVHWENLTQPEASHQGR